MPQAKRHSTRKRRQFKPYPMSDAESANLEEFIASGRVGRRNAMPDILDKGRAGVGTAGLAETLEKLKCSDAESSKSDQACADPGAAGGKSENESKDAKS